MKRSTGVTVIAILSFIGSVFTLLVATVMAMVKPWAQGSSDLPGSPAFSKAIMVGAVLVYLLFALWGILTGIGLLRLRNWARVSTIVFSTLLIVTGAFAILPIFLPLASSPNQPGGASAMVSVRVFMAAFALLLLGTGVCWAVYFTRARVRGQFSSPAVSAEGMTTHGLPPQRRRPLSITIIGWWLLSCCLFLPLNLWLHTPAILLTKVITSRVIAGIYFAVFATLSLYVGVGLLRLRPIARTLGIAYFTFSFVNGTVFYFAPGGHARILALIDRVGSTYSWARPWQGLVRPAVPEPYLIMGIVIGTATLLLPLYFLITRKQVFTYELSTPTSETGQA